MKIHTPQQARCVTATPLPVQPHFTAVFTVVYKTLIYVSAAMLRSVSSALGLFICPAAVFGFIILKCKNILHCGLRHVRNASINTESPSLSLPLFSLFLPLSTRSQPTELWKFNSHIIDKQSTLLQVGKSRRRRSRSRRVALVVDRSWPATRSDVSEACLRCARVYAGAGNSSPKCQLKLHMNIEYASANLSVAAAGAAVDGVIDMK